MYTRLIQDNFDIINEKNTVTQVFLKKLIYTIIFSVEIELRESGII